MEQILEKWKTCAIDSPIWNKIVLQTWSYGFLCWLKDSSEMGKWVEVTFEEFFDYADEFRDMPIGGVSGYLMPAFSKLLTKPLLSAEKIDEFHEKLLDLVEEHVQKEINIIDELFEGEPLKEETREKVWQELSFIIEPSTKKPNKTRHVKGKRAITPIKRRGRQAKTRKL